MSRYLACLEVDDKKLDEIMSRINSAQEEIMECYHELRGLCAIKVSSISDKEESAAE